MKFYQFVFASVLWAVLCMRTFAKISKFGGSVEVGWCRWFSGRVVDYQQLYYRRPLIWHPYDPIICYDIKIWKIHKFDLCHESHNFAPTNARTPERIERIVTRNMEVFNIFAIANYETFFEVRKINLCISKEFTITQPEFWNFWPDGPYGVCQQLYD